MNSTAIAPQPPPDSHRCLLLLITVKNPSSNVLCWVACHQGSTFGHCQQAISYMGLSFLRLLLFGLCSTETNRKSENSIWVGLQPEKGPARWEKILQGYPFIPFGFLVKSQNGCLFFLGVPSLGLVSKETIGSTSHEFVSGLF